MNSTAPPLFTFFLPNLSAGGAERVLLGISGVLVNRGFRCDVVTAQSGGAWEDAIPAGVRYICLHRNKPLHSVLRLRRYLRCERPSAMLSSVFSANFAALLACYGLPVLCIVREAYRAANEVKTDSVLTTLANKMALRFLYPRADAVIALSDKLAAHISEVAHVSLDRIHVIPNPVLPRVIGHSEPAVALLKNSAPLILACGRLERQKDFATLLQAFALVRVQRPARLVVLGEGSEYSALIALAATLGIEHDVEFPGYEPNPHDWMRHAQVFVSTSLCEGFPNVLLEALDNGCQVVSTDSSDTVAEILGNGRFGAIVPVGGTVEIARSILAILSNHQSYPSAREHLRTYDLNAIADRYLHALTSNAVIGFEPLS
jgi:glycosyltransferase involved in cell wall biosynthesis